jgi:hypothetical protein
VLVLEVAHNPIFEDGGLADVDYFALGVTMKIHAGFGGQGFELVAEWVGHEGIILDCDFV